METYNVQYPAAETREFSDYAMGLNINDTNDKIITDDSKQSAISVQSDGDS